MSSGAPPPDPLLLDAAEVAQSLKVSRATLYRLDEAGQLPRPVTLGKIRRWRAAELRAWADAGCPPRDAWEAMQDPARPNGRT